MKSVVTGLAVLLPALSFGLDWKFQRRPPVESLTNEERYVTWKFRMDVADPSTGQDLETLKAEIHRRANEMKNSTGTVSV